MNQQFTDAMNRELAAASPGLVGNDDLLRGILSGCGDCIKVLDLEGRLQFMSEGGKRVMEVDDFSLLKGCPWPDFWEGEGNTQAKAAVAAAKAGGTGRFRNHANTAKGTPRYWDVQVSPVLGQDGAPTHLLSISRDITEEWTAAEELRKTADRQKFLADELTHRVKNALATVGAIANQSFRGDVYKEGREVFTARLQSLASAYTILNDAAWADGDMRRIVEGALVPYRNLNGNIAVDGPDVTIPPGRALTMALAINELATNAAKYGALSVNGGQVAINWTSESVGGKIRFRFSWIERNGPAVAPPVRTGFGSRLVKNILAQDFGGTVELLYEPSGLICILDAAPA